MENELNSRQSRKQSPERGHTRVSKRQKEKYKNVQSPVRKIMRTSKPRDPKSTKNKLILILTLYKDC